MKIKFIGTGSGKTSLNRFHSSIMILSGDFNLLIDTGDGISKALAAAGMDLNSVSAILYTHMHPDHSSGLPLLLVQFKMLSRKKKLLIYCSEHHRENLLSLLTATHIFPENLGFPLQFVTFRQGDLTDTGAGIKFMALANSHLDEMKEKYPANRSILSFGYLFYLNDRKLFYSGDIRDEGDLFKIGIGKINFMITECTHVDIDKILKAFNTSGAEYLYLTHIPDENYIDMSDERVIYASDGDEFDI